MSHRARRARLSPSAVGPRRVLLSPRRECNHVWLNVSFARLARVAVDRRAGRFGACLGRRRFLADRSTASGQPRDDLPRRLRHAAHRWRNGRGGAVRLRLLPGRGLLLADRRIVRDGAGPTGGAVWQAVFGQGHAQLRVRDPRALEGRFRQAGADAAPRGRRLCRRHQLLSGNPSADQAQAAEEDRAVAPAGIRAHRDAGAGRRAHARFDRRSTQQLRAAQAGDRGSRGVGEQRLGHRRQPHPKRQADVVDQSAPAVLRLRPVLRSALAQRRGLEFHRRRLLRHAVAGDRPHRILRLGYDDQRAERRQFVGARRSTIPANRSTTATAAAIARRSNGKTPSRSSGPAASTPSIARSARRITDRSSRKSATRSTCRPRSASCSSRCCRGKACG